MAAISGLTRGHALSFWLLQQLHLPSPRQTRNLKNFRNVNVFISCFSSSNFRLNRDLKKLNIYARQISLLGSRFSEKNNPTPRKINLQHRHTVSDYLNLFYSAGTVEHSWLVVTIHL